MKFENLNFVDGCACCHTFRDAVFKTYLGQEVTVSEIPQEDGGVLYSVIVQISDNKFEKYFKLTKEETSNLIFDMQ